MPAKTPAKKIKKKPEIIPLDPTPDDNTPNLQQQMFSRYYLFGCNVEGAKFRLGNGSQSYAKAYGVSVDNVSEAEASRLLRNVKVQEYMRQLLIESGWNNNIVDARTQEIMLCGKGADSMIAIREYNKIAQRISDKIDLNHSGEITTTVREMAREMGIKQIKPDK